jgi:hypothetical protein
MLLDAGVRLHKRQPEPMVDAWRHNRVDTATDRAGVVTCPKMRLVAIRTNPKAARDSLRRISFGFLN